MTFWRRLACTSCGASRLWCEARDDPQRQGSGGQDGARSVISTDTHQQGGVSISVILILRGCRGFSRSPRLPRRGASAPIFCSLPTLIISLDIDHRLGLVFGVKGTLAMSLLLFAIPTPASPARGMNRMAPLGNVCQPATMPVNRTKRTKSIFLLRPKPECH